MPKGKKTTSKSKEDEPEVCENLMDQFMDENLTDERGTELMFEMTEKKCISDEFLQKMADSKKKNT